MARKKIKNKGEVANAFIMVLQFGIGILTPILICTFLGYFLTKHTGSKGYAVAGIVIGLVSGINGGYRSLKKYINPKNNCENYANRLEKNTNKDDN